MAINLFLLGLVVHAAGGQSISPTASLIGSVPSGLVATWAAALWVRSLIRQADGPGH